MDRKELEFCELLCAKFCHDLSGPIGAINNGIDFLESDNESMKEKAGDLVKLSSNQAVNRLAFFRQAYGSVSVHNEISLNQVKSYLMKFVQDTKIELDFDYKNIPDSHIEQLMSKVVLNLVLISSNVILLNGNIKVNIEGSDSLTIEANGPVAKIDEELVEVLSGNYKSVQVTTRNVQQFYTCFLIKALGARIEVSNTKSGIHLSLSR